ncbi:DMT family transporter [Fictibacillus sp. FJAT-27399]|uniref:DMT family transporter n=1 Tax=Fictibacillus sp. FJAT-27399 TaxID=1729689 RepID=UPI0006A76660|nr:EamA family transporter [Fictibacillus sp. FJAT-27399]SFD52534.1 Threonine/homoserine efflux transporter RhtA [Bacillus sp. OV194]
MKWPYIWIASGAALWGTIGIFIKELSSLGFTPIQIVVLRALGAAIAFIIITLFTDRSLLRIKLRDTHYFIGTGLLSIAFFNWCYFKAMEEMSLSVAAVLLYTAPAFVLILSRIFFNDLITGKKLTALGVTFLGCLFVVGYMPSAKAGITLSGLLTGLGAGLGYSLYSIFGKAASAKYHTLTITTFTFIFAGLALFPVSGLASSIHLLENGKAFLYISGLGIIPTVFAYILYTVGLRQVEPSRAAIVSTIEPVVATLTGFFLFKEELTLLQTIGILLVISAAVLVQDKKTSASLHQKTTNVS